MESVNMKWKAIKNEQDLDTLLLEFDKYKFIDKSAALMKVRQFLELILIKCEIPGDRLIDKIKNLKCSKRIKSYMQYIRKSSK